MPIRVLDSDGAGEVWRLAAGLNWAANHGANIVNLSLGVSENSGVLRNVMQAMNSNSGGADDGTFFPEIGRGNLFISVAAGNGGDSIKVYPAAENVPGKISVASFSLNDQLSAFSSYDNTWVDVVAPGDFIVSTLPGGQYGAWSGTSMASPIVAGLAALLKAQNPNDFNRPEQLVQLIRQRSTPARYLLNPWGKVNSANVDALCAVSPKCNQ
jgi:thermitase